MQGDAAANGNKARYGPRLAHNFSARLCGVTNHCCFAQCKGMASTAIHHACMLHVPLSHNPSSCMQQYHVSRHPRHPPGRPAHAVAHGLPHHTGLRLLLLAGAGACAAPCCTTPQHHSTDGSLPAPPGAVRSKKLHLQQGSQFILLEQFGVQSACFTERKAARYEVVLLSV
jgi:hypothetical protein